MEDAVTPTAAGLKRVPVVESGTRVPVVESATQVPVVAGDEGKATPRATTLNMRAKTVLGLLGDLANMKEISSSKAVQDRLRAITSLVEIDLDLELPKAESQSGPEPEPEAQSGPTCIVKECLVEDWKSDIFTGYDEDGPVIHAYYQQLQGTPSSRCKPVDDPNVAEPSLGKPTTGQPRDRKNLRRVLITSRAIHAEFQRILHGTVTFPLRIPPPFKILVQFLPQLQQRLSDLKAELGDEERLQNTPEEGASDPGQAQGQRDEKTNEGNSDAANVSTEAGLLGDKSTGSSGLPRLQTDRAHRLQESVSHLGLLLTFINDELAETIHLPSKIEDGTLKEIEFEDLWLLFQPGDTILSARGPNQKILKICAVTGGQVQLRNYNPDEIRQMGYSRPPLRPENNSDLRTYDLTREEAAGAGIWTQLTIDCYAMGFDGTDVGPLDSCVRIRHYRGKMAITDLDVYPLRFHPNSAGLLAKMEERGRKVLASYGHKRYNGAIINQAGDETYEEIRSDVFIDMNWYYQNVQVAGMGSGYPPPGAMQAMFSRRLKLGRLLKTLPNPTETSEYYFGKKTCQMSGTEVDTRLFEDFMSANRQGFGVVKASGPFVTSSHLQLMTYSVVGYAFRYRKWYFLDIDLVEDIDFERESRESGFQELVVPKRHRDLLVALVDTHMSETQVLTAAQTNDNPVPGSSNNQIDLVKGKGQGVIILLHGPPGSGKTSTAETIAAYTKRPLYSLTTGDIGVNPTIAERNLMEHTKQADKWGCVLLLDEGDVFLMQRDWDHIDRNALVSVFLRELEYYSGIMFLTTNRPGVLDEAFKSRIHITLNYPSIDFESTRTMWTNILNRLERDNETNAIKILFNRDELLDFAERHYRQHHHTGATWNGRQIRNAFRTALALGHHERVCLLRDEGLTPVQAALSGKKKWMRVRLTRANFKKIAKTSNDFEEYLVGLRGQDSDKMRNSEIRDDLFDFLGEAVQMKQHQHLQQIQVARKDYGGASNSGGARGKVKQLSEDKGSGKGSQQSSVRCGSIGGKGKKEKEKEKAVDYGYDDKDEDEEEERGYDDDDDDDDVETDD